VALEEVGVEALAEAVGDPGLEVVLASLGLDGGPHVAEGAAHELDRAELLDDVGALQRVVEVAAAPVDARHARRIRNSSPMISSQRSLTSSLLVKKRWPPRSKR